MTAGDHAPCGQQLTAALLTPIGRGAVATIRLQGDLDSLAARGKRGQTLSGHTISKSNRLPSKGSDPFYHGLQDLNQQTVQTWRNSDPRTLGPAVND